MYFYRRKISNNWVIGGVLDIFYSLFLVLGGRHIVGFAQFDFNSLTYIPALIHKIQQIFLRVPAFRGVLQTYPCDQL